MTDGIFQLFGCLMQHCLDIDGSYNGFVMDIVSSVHMVAAIFYVGRDRKDLFPVLLVVAPCWNDSLPELALDCRL